jgi:hypothetical protein
MIADRPAGRPQIEAYYRFRLRIFFENLSSASPNSIAPGQPEPALFQIEEVLSQCERSGWAPALRAHRASSAGGPASIELDQCPFLTGLQLSLSRIDLNGVSYGKMWMSLQR